MIVMLLMQLLLTVGLYSVGSREGFGYLIPSGGGMNVSTSWRLDVSLFSLFQFFLHYHPRRRLWVFSGAAQHSHHPARRGHWRGPNGAIHTDSNERRVSCILVSLGGNN